MTHDTIRAAIDALRPFAEIGRKSTIPHPEEEISLYIKVADLRRAAEALAALEALPAQQGMDDGSKATCEDCERTYGDEHGFPDLIIPYWAWKEISPTGDDGGLLCPSCICKRLHEKKIRCEGAFMSGPIISVDQTTMHTARRVENIELAIEGRDNTWSGIREMVSPASPDQAAPEESGDTLDVG